MSYAIRNDLRGCRSINHPSEVGKDEHFSETELPPVEPSEAELVETAMNTRSRLLAVAANEVGPLQDAIDEESATVEEMALLKLWQQYRIALNRITQQPGFPTDVQWPAPPTASWESP